MDDHLKGVTVALILVCAAAIGVAFASSIKSKNTGKQIGTLKGQIQNLSQSKSSLEKELTHLKAEYQQEAALAQSLKQALAQEQMKNRNMGEELQRKQPQRTMEDAASNTTESSEDKKAGGQNFTSGSR